MEYTQIVLNEGTILYNVVPGVYYYAVIIWKINSRYQLKANRKRYVFNQSLSEITVYDAQTKILHTCNTITSLIESSGLLFVSIKNSITEAKTVSPPSYEHRPALNNNDRLFVPIMSPTKSRVL